jgi:DNA-binding winged helix-turn-helix (wHTH) protein
VPLVLDARNATLSDGDVILRLTQRETEILGLLIERQPACISALGTASGRTGSAGFT